MSSKEFRVWVRIEEADLENEEYNDINEPIDIARFDNLADAEAFATPGTEIRLRGVE